jgi:hypothetical protein
MSPQSHNVWRSVLDAPTSSVRPVAREYEKESTSTHNINELDEGLHLRLARVAKNGTAEIYLINMKCAVWKCTIEGSEGTLVTSMP